MQKPTGNMPLPLVSVVIPTYNSAQFVGDAVKSVLEQTYSRHEIIVVDDGSTDNTKEVLQLFGERIQYIHQENRGPSAARNTGIRLAKGAYICFLDADDLWLPGKLEVQVSFMERHKDVGLVLSDHEEFDSTGVVLESFIAAKKFRSELTLPGLVEKPFSKLVAENFISTPTVIIRRECFEKAGLFDETLRSVEDRDLWLRIAANYDIACLPMVVCRRRLHGSNISFEQELSMTSRIKTLEKNRRCFPELAAPAIWHRQLGDAYCQLSYIRLEKNQRVRALQACLKSLRHGMNLVLASGSLNAYPWLLSAGAIPSALLGWKLSRYLWRTTSSLLEKSVDDSSPV